MRWNWSGDVVGGDFRSGEMQVIRFFGSFFRLSRQRGGEYFRLKSGSGHHGENMAKITVHCRNILSSKVEFNTDKGLMDCFEWAVVMTSHHFLIWLLWVVRLCADFDRRCSAWWENRKKNVKQARRHLANEIKTRYELRVEADATILFSCGK